MAYSNLLDSDAVAFTLAGAAAWSVDNGTSRRILERSPYPLDFVGDNSEVYGNVLSITSDGVGVTKVSSPDFSAQAGTAYSFVCNVSTALYDDLRDSFVELSIDWFDGDQNPIATDPVTDFQFQNVSDTAVDPPRWHRVQVHDQCPESAATGKVVLEFSSTTLGSGTTDGDRWAFFEPSVFDADTSLSDFALGAYGDLPDFMQRDDDEVVSDINNTRRPLQKFMGILSTRHGQVSDLAESFDYTRALDDPDGVESSSALTDPYLISPGGLPWLASLIGSKLFTGAANFTPWNYFAGFTWTQWEEDIVPGGVDPDTDWGAIENAALGFVDSSGTYRDQIATGFNGVHAGRPDTIIEFIRTLLNSSTPEDEVVVLRKRDRDNPFLVELSIDSAVDPDPGGALVQNILNLGLPAGVTAEVSSTAEPLSHSAISRYFDTADLAVGAGIVAGAAEWPLQGFANFEGGPNCAVLEKDIPIQVDGGYGGVIAESPYAVGYGLFSGNRVAAETATSAVLDPVGDFDIIVGVSNVVEPGAATGSGTETGTFGPSGIEGRVIASGNNWSLHMTKDQKISLVFNGDDIGEEVLTSPDAHPFQQHSETTVIWIRVQKVDGDVTFYSSHDLYNDWDGKTLGAAQTLTVGNEAMVSSGAASYVRVLENANPGVNAWDTSLTCVVHRFLMYTGTLGTGAWSPDADGNYDYASGAVVDINFNTDPSSNYDVSFTESSINTLAVTVSDLSGGAAAKAHVMLYSANHGDTFYFGKSPDQFDAANPDNAGDTLTALVADGTYDWKMSYIDTSDDSIITETVTSVVAGGGAGITWDADDYGDRCITQLEVVLSSSGVFDAGNDEAMFLPATLPLATGSTADSAAAVISAADSSTLGPTTWELDRAWDTTDEYLPSQLIDRDFIHTQDGQICIPNSMPLSINSHRSYAIVYRNDGANSDTPVFSQRDDSSNGVIFFHVTTSARLTSTDGTSTDTVTFNLGSESRIGEWNLLVFRVDPAFGVSMFVNDAEKAFVPHTLTDELDTLTSDKILIGSAVQKTEGAIASFMTFNRYLSDDECLALAAEKGIV